MSQYLKAIESANSALKLDSKNIKAMFRRAQAQFFRQELEYAKSDVLTVIQLDPKSKDARDLYQSISQKMKEYRQKESRLFAGLFEKVQLVDETELQANKKPTVPASDSDGDVDEMETGIPSVENKTKVIKMEE
jgi:FK506-binding protein 4/5